MGIILSPNNVLLINFNISENLYVFSCNRKGTGTGTTNRNNKKESAQWMAFMLLFVVRTVVASCNKIIPLDFDLQNLMTSNDGGISVFRFFCHLLSWFCVWLCFGVLPVEILFNWYFQNGIFHASVRFLPQPFPRTFRWFLWYCDR